MIRFIILLTGCLLAKEPTNGRIQNMPPDVDHTIWDGNNISTIHGNHGDIVSYHLTWNASLEWPNGNDTYSIFQNGLMASSRCHKRK